MNAYHIQVIYDAGRWEYSFDGYEMVYASAIFERLDKELHLFSQRIYIYISMLHDRYLYVHIYLKQVIEFNSIIPEENCPHKK